MSQRTQIEAVVTPSQEDRFVRQRDLVPAAELANVLLHVVGVGAIGRQVALQLAAIGARQVMLVDFDTVEDHNRTTQGYRLADVGQAKVDATRAAMLEVDPEIQITTHNAKWELEFLSRGIVISCVDSMDARRLVWGHVQARAPDMCPLFLDARMLGETVRVLAVSRPSKDMAYDDSLYSDGEAEAGSCTSRSTFYAASLAATLLVQQLLRHLRGERTDLDQLFSLKASMYTVDSNELVVK